VRNTLTLICAGCRQDAAVHLHNIVHALFDHVDASPDLFHLDGEGESQERVSLFLRRHRGWELLDDKGTQADDMKHFKTMCITEGVRTYS